MRLVTHLATMLVAAAALGSPTAWAQDAGPDQITDRKFRVQKNLGVTGQVLGYAGPVAVGAGAAFLYGGVIDSATGSNEDNLGAGLAFLLIGQTAAVTGPAMLAGATTSGAGTVRRAGGEVSATAGYISIGGSLVQTTTLVARATGADPSLVWLGVAGWATAMTAGTIQHNKNVNAYLRLADARVPSKRFQIALVPTGNGAALAGTF